MNVEKDNRGSSELIKREDIKESPFTIITIDGKSFGTMGNYRLTEEGTKDQIKKELSKITWNRIIQVTMILNEIKDEVNEKLIKQTK
jgi:hypothetical protein